MEDLKFPILKESLPPPILSMNDYAKFIQDTLLHPVFPEVEREEGNKVTVFGVRFKL